MPDGTLYMLAPGVELVPVVPADASAADSASEKTANVVLTHSHTRKRSKMVSGSAAALLAQFRTPCTWAQAIMQQAAQQELDPQELADEAFRLLLTMEKEGYLVPHSTGLTVHSHPLLSPGAQFRRYRVKEVIQHFDDSAVYRLQDDAGVTYALKLFHLPGDDGAPPSFTNTVSALEKLDLLVAPERVEQGQEGEHFFVITTWCEGVTVEKRACRFRNYNVQSNLLAVVDLCVAVAAAYQHLHAQGVLHGDVHPNNLLCDESGAIKIVDFDFAAPVDGGSRRHRGGIDYYFDPQLAAAIVEAQPIPAASQTSERYAISVLLYRLIAGQHYLRFSNDPTTAYRQMMEEPPLSFSAFDLSLPTVFDEVFGKALSKNADGRFKTLPDFISGLHRCRNAVAQSDLPVIAGRKDDSERFTTFLLRKYGWDSPLLHRGLTVAPTASVNNGAAGIAYFFYRLSCIRNEPGLLALADVWANKAAGYKKDPGNAFYAAAEQLTPASIGNCSLYHSAAGVHVVQALISMAAGDRYNAQKSIGDFLAAASQPTRHIDLSLGTAGLVLGSAILWREWQTRTDDGSGSLRLVTDNLLTTLWDQLDSYPAMDQPNPVDYFGMAHGWAGMLYATAFWCGVAGSPLPAGFPARVEQLLNQRQEENGTARWPISTTDTACWPGWCHGAAGYTLLWSQLYEQTGEEKYLATALQSAAAFYPDSISVGHLCCGLAGQAYARLKLFQLTGDSSHWKGVQRLRVDLIQHLSSPALRPNSLYRGEVGIAVLLAELENPSLARMPLFG